MSALSTAVEVPVRPIHETHGELAAWIAAELERWRLTTRGRPDRTLVLSLPAPLTEPEALLEIAAAHGDRPDPRDLMDFFWHPSGRAARAGAGAVHCLKVQGEDRLQQLQRDARRVWKGLETATHPDCPLPVAPRFFGGLAFDVGAADGDPWHAFGDGCFTQPRYLYTREGERASLTVALRADETASDDERISEISALLEALASWRQAPTMAPTVIEIERPPRTLFGERVESIRAAIAAGSFSKIVAAGCSRAELANPLEPGAVLRRLHQGLLSPARSRDTRFAFCRENATFVGATPERLIARRGMTIETEALAGSIASGDHHGEQLLASGKDLREHQLVVDSIVRRLRPMTARLEVADQPQIRELRDVLHLQTPVSGTLSTPRHVLELVAELHPTPAVGGVPTREAMGWIREHEPQARGWYAAPVGWFDAEGDGEFAVALRSCVLRGAEAFIYAGAGIVRDSDPELEYTETELKKQTLLTALGA